MKNDLKRKLRSNKGFSLVELMVGLLIMAVVSGVAITLVGGVLDTTKGRADKETADLITRSIQDYVAASGDSTLALLGIVDGTTSTEDLVERLTYQITIAKSGDTTGTSTFNKLNTTTNSIDVTNTALATGVTCKKDVVPGTYGPIIDPAKMQKTPTQSVSKSWDIIVNSDINTVVVKPSATVGLKVDITP